MYCPKCGKEIFDEAIVCPYCGCAIKENNPASLNSVNSTNAPVIENGETPGLATAALIFAFVMPIVGLILGIVGLTKYSSQSLRNKCIAAIPISIVVWIISAIIVFSNM